MKTVLLIAILGFILSSCGSDPSFGEKEYIVVVEIEGKGKVSGSGAFALDETCTLVAKPDSVRGFRFSHWEQLPECFYLNKDSVYSFTVDESRSLKAVFTSNE